MRSGTSYVRLWPFADIKIGAGVGKARNKILGTDLTPL